MSDYPNKIPISGFHCSMCQHESANYCSLECSCCCSGESADEYFGITDEEDKLS